MNAIQKLVKPARVGHAGTLDPLATGVLIACVGPATRLAKYAQALPKTYVADFRLGLESDTEDISGAVVEVAGADTVSTSQLESVLPEFAGKISQLPPKFSALKLNGKRAYQLARKGKKVELSPREVEIYEIQLNKFAYPDFQITLRCGSGTYVRSIGRDIGKRLGSGAIMTRLVRTAVGDFRSTEGISSEDLTWEKVKSHLISPQQGLPEFPRISVPDTQVEKFANGHAWSVDTPTEIDEAFAIDQSDRLLTILKQRSPGHYTPAINFSKYWLEHPSGR